MTPHYLYFFVVSHRFDGKYVTGDIDAAYIERVAASRNDTSRFGSDSTTRSEASLINVHNDV